MWRNHAAWSRLTTIGHLIGGGAALVASAVAWRQLGRTATQLAATARVATGDDVLAFPPHIAVIIPARNEAHGIASCLASLTGQQLAPEDIWVVDDGSTDATADVVRTLALRDPRLHLVGGAPCPPGWAGKNWALHQGIGAALSAHPPGLNQWLLLTDADTLHHPDLLSRAYAYALAASLHLVSAQPRVAESAWSVVALRGAIGEFYSFYYGLDSLARRREDTPATVIAQGQFMLVQRAWYQATGGFAHPLLRAALDDDRALAARITHIGGHVGILAQPELLATTGYASLSAAWRGHRHHVAPMLTSSRRAWQIVCALVLVDVAMLLPVFGLAHAAQLGVMHGWRRHWLALIRWAAQLGAVTLLRWRAARMSDLPQWYPAIAPWGSLLLQRFILQMLWRHVTGSGHIDWKGRRYHDVRGEV